MMTVNCRICGHSLNTNRIGQDGEQDLVRKMGLHIQSHPKANQELAEKFVCLSAFLVMRDYMRIPDNEPELRKKNDDLFPVVLGILGLQTTEKAN